jgi:phosphatidate cytidylyltransferase
VLKDRIRSAVIAVSILIGLLFLDAVMDTAFLSATLMLVAILAGLGEFAALTEKGTARLFLNAAGIFSIIYITLLTQGVGLPVLVALAVVLFATLAVLQVVRDDGHAVENIGATALAFFYVTVMGGFLLKIRLLGVTTPEIQMVGVKYMLFFILTVKSSDIGAYFIGREFGTTKLIPMLSPGKTRAGLYGAVVTSALVAALLSLVIPALSFFSAILFGAIMGLLGQAGDLFESLLKRNADIKDSGAMIPGMGGVLDVLDSLILTAPVGYALLCWMTSH